MAFRFALAPLLRLRQSIERQRALRLREASLAVARAQDSLAQLERFLVDSAQSDSASLSAGRRAADLQFASLYRENLERLREELQSEVHKLELARQKAAAEYHQAFREREVLATIRARLRRDYQQDELRREQQQLDAAHLLQRWHHRSG
jgi:flagellar export protein FliJ